MTDKVTSDNFFDKLSESLQEGVDHANGTKPAKATYVSNGKLEFSSKKVHCPDCGEDCTMMYDEDENFDRIYYCPVCDQNFIP